MSVFGEYARYYDFCYAGKDYAAECAFLEAAFRRFGSEPRALLDLACGTGGHGLLLAGAGYAVCGVDRSPEMLARFAEKAAAAGVPVELHCQDLRALDLGRRFDAAVCLFDAFCYLTTNDDLRAGLGRIREHMRPGGLLVFDCWHAAPLLRGHDPLRVRELVGEEGQRVLRLSSTTLHPERQVAEVSFRLLVHEGDRLAADFTEVHPLRYFLPAELAFILEATGWRVLHLGPAFGLDAPITGDTWHLAAVAAPADPAE